MQCKYITTLPIAPGGIPQSARAMRIGETNTDLRAGPAVRRGRSRVEEDAE